MACMHTCTMKLRLKLQSQKISVRTDLMAGAATGRGL